MQFLAEYGLFLAKAVTVVVMALGLFAGLFAISARARPRLKEGLKERIEVKHLNHQYESMREALEQAMVSGKALRRLRKQHKRKAEQSRAARDSGERSRKRIFVLDFHGNVLASAVASMRQEISAVLTVARPEDEILLRLESGGGLVHAYGLAASQLLRIKNRNIALTIAVDKIAASGGYMMACVADRLMAAPFAVIGSIGVVAQLPNFHRLLKRNDVDFEQITAGEFKRTLTLFGENTDRAREKVREDVEDTHLLFKDFIKQQRNGVDIDKVATGEHWYGSRALELGLVDELRTSDEYLMQAADSADLYQITYAAPRSLRKLLALGAAAIARWSARA
jgi:serine protease SohB